MSRRSYQPVLLLGLTLLLASACSSARPPATASPVRPAPPGGVSAVKLGIDADGTYEVTAHSLAGAGFDLGAVPREKVSLTAGGQPVPFEWIGQGDSLAIRFHGLRLSSDSYIPRNIYWLRSDAAPAPDAPSGPKPEPSPTPTAASGIVTATLLLEQDLQYDPQAANLVERWYWQTIFAPAKVELSFDAPGLQDGPGQLDISLIAKSSSKVNPDHRLLVFVNGAFVSDAPWDGAVPHQVTAVIPPGVLKEKGNQVVIQAPGDTGAEADSVQLHYVDIAYPRAAADAATAAAKPREPASIEPVSTNPLPDWPGGADLVIVTVPQFHDALKPLVDARAKQGLRVAVLDTDQIYDAFSYGRVDPKAIQDLMRHARANWQGPAPRYLLLAGDASYDVLGNTKGPEGDLVPTHDVYTTFSGWTGSDVWYALPDDSETALPAFAVGRFPAQTPEQLSAMVQKTLGYEAQGGDLGWRSDALLVADNDDQGFSEEGAAFADELKGYRSSQVRVEGDGSNAKTALLDGFKSGTGLIGYFGHGSVTLWAQEKVFDVTEAAKLANKDRLPIVFTVTCLSGYFEHPLTVSLGEALLRNPNGGAVAALVPSSAAVLSDQRLLAQGLAKSLAEPGARALGDTILDAQLGLPQGPSGVREILLTFNLLGDPSLQVKR